MRVALVTGGATGIGAATVAEFAAKKINVALQYSSSKNEAEKLVGQLSKAGQEPLWFTRYFGKQCRVDDRCQHHRYERRSLG